MKFDVGDIVILKRNAEVAKVVRLIDEEMVEVEIDDTRFPIYIDELETQYFKLFSEQRAKAKEKQSEDPEAFHQRETFDAPKGFHFSFSPIFEYDGFEDVVVKLKVYFINMSAYTLAFRYDCQLNEESLFKDTYSVSPYDHVFLHEIKFAEMQEQPRFYCDLSQTANRDLERELHEIVKLRPKKMFEEIAQLQKSLKPMFHILIAKDFASLSPENKTKDKKISIKGTPIPVSGKVKKPGKTIAEIDLHLESLAPNVKGLNNFEILNLQLKALEEAIDRALNAHQQSLIVIHGVGKGKLKEEVHALLRSNFDIDYYVHDWMPRYGYGATEIIFKI